MRMKFGLMLIIIGMNMTCFCQVWNWAEAYGSNQTFNLLEIKKGNDDDVFICGRIMDTLVIGADTLIPPDIYPMGFIARLDTNHNFFWARTFNVNSIQITDLEVTQNNEIIVLAAIKNAVTIDNFEINYLLGENVIMKLSENGQVLNVHNFGDRYIPGTVGGWNMINSRMSLDNSGNSIVSFNYMDTAYFALDTLIGNGFGATHGMIKLNPDFQEEWVREVPVSGSIYDLITDVNNDILIVGKTQGPLTLDTLQFPATCGSAGFIAKLSNQTDGAPTFVWQKNIQSINGCAFGQIAVSSYFLRLATDNEANVYATGSFMNIVQFGNLVITPSINNNINSNLIVSKLDAFGNILWYKTAIAPVSHGLDLKISDCGSVYVCGIFYGSIDIGSGFVHNQQGPNGFRSLFVTFLDSQGNTLWSEMATTNTSTSCIERITEEKIWVGGNSAFIPIVFGPNTPNSSLSGSFFLAEISQSAEECSPCDFGPCSTYCEIIDFNNSNSITIDDLNLLISEFGCNIDCSPYDITGNGVVGIDDLMLFISLFSSCE